ncbi:MAG: 16S rRNA (uracil(1498)-N(3))-methyltransferase [Polyangiaceae bacterium]|nr:16S rRNA (uracil(1498)-N(3))-methyltransferase [Polyangiaceae bacterium]
MPDRPRRVPIADLGPGQRRLDGALGHYLGRVLRLRAGDSFVAFDPATGREADVSTRHVDAEAVVIWVGALRERGGAPARELAWVQSLPKGDKCDAIVRDATELGATRIVVATTRRGVVRLDPARAGARAGRWTRIAREAARQCGRSKAPEVHGPLPWSDALASAANVGGVGARPARFCLWEGAREPLGPALFEALANAGSLVFTCGPEGGLDDDEVDAARALGFRVVSLGERILRTETVAAAVLGAVAVWGGASEET